MARWHEDTAIVGFHGDVDIHNARELLRPAPGFRRVERMLRVSSATLVSIEEGSFERFSIMARELPRVAYAHPNYRLRPATFSDAVHSEYTCGNWVTLLRDQHDLGESRLGLARQLITES